MNRLEKYMEQVTSSDPSSSEEHFIQVPSMFHQGLTPEQYAALQQTYQTAYERARQQAQSGGDFFDCFNPDLGAGI